MNSSHKNHTEKQFSSQNYITARRHTYRQVCVLQWINQRTYRYIFFIAEKVKIHVFHYTLKNFEALAYPAFVSIGQTIGLALSLALHIFWCLP